jgi:sugar lactone lactonase YvrE
MLSTKNYAHTGINKSKTKNPVKKAAAKYLPTFVFYLPLLILLASCSKKQAPIPDPQPSPKVLVTSMSTHEGTYNSTVEIYGYGFSTNIADDKVFFNDKEAEITKATTTQLTVLVPKGALSGLVQVSANGEINQNKQPFIYDLTATVSAFAGNGTAGATNGDAATASFNAPAGLAADTLGNVYVADAGNNLIRKISPAGVVTTLAGPEGFNGPNSLAVDAAGNVYVTDAGNNQIKKITPAGVVSVLAGNGTQGVEDGIGTAASFNHPSGIVVDNNGVLFIADSGNNTIRMIAADGTVINWGVGAGNNYPVGIAGNGFGLIVAQQGNNTVSYYGTTIGKPGAQGADNGENNVATFNHPAGLVIAPGGLVYVADEFNNRIRAIEDVNTAQFENVIAVYVSVSAGIGAPGSANGTGTVATFNHPRGIAVDANGTLYVSDSGNNLIRKITIEKR